MCGEAVFAEEQPQIARALVGILAHLPDDLAEALRLLDLARVVVAEFHAPPIVAVVLPLLGR